MNQANGFSFEFWRVSRCRPRHRVDSLRRLSHPKLWFVRRPGSSPDREEATLEQFYRDLKDSDVYSDTEKSRQAWSKYEQAKTSITAKRERAKEQLESSIRSA